MSNSRNAIALQKLTDIVVQVVRNANGSSIARFQISFSGVIILKARRGPENECLVLITFKLLSLLCGFVVCMYSRAQL